MSIVGPRSFSFCVFRESELVDLSGFYRWTASIMVRDLFASHGYKWTNRNEKFQNGSFTFLVEKEKQSKGKQRKVQKLGIKKAVVGVIFSVRLVKI